MLPDPLHPAIVHMPLALAVLVPLLIIVALFWTRKGANVYVAWFPVALLSVLMYGSALLATNTGEDEEDTVEQVVSKSTIHEHEERAERFVWGAGILALVSLGGFLKGRWAVTARWASLVISIVALVLAVQTGASGGELVYEHGAASAYMEE